MRLTGACCPRDGSAGAATGGRSAPAAALAGAVRDAARLSRRDVEVVHVVGGGSLNTLLCQLTADAVGPPVVAGPVEATALGNVLVQARAHGAVSGDLEALRALVRRTQQLHELRPRTPSPSR